MAVNKTGEGPGLMASIRSRSRKDGSEYFSVVYRFHGKQWLNRHIENLTGVDPNTKTKYQGHVRKRPPSGPGGAAADGPVDSRGVNRRGSAV